MGYRRVDKSILWLAVCKYLKGELTQHEVASQCNLKLPTFKKAWRCYKRFGDVCPQRGPRKRRSDAIFSADDLSFLADLVTDEPMLFLDEIAERMYYVRNLARRPSVSLICRAFQVCVCGIASNCCVRVDP